MIRAIDKLMMFLGGFLLILLGALVGHYDYFVVATGLWAVGTFLMLDSYRTMRAARREWLREIVEDSSMPRELREEARERLREMDQADEAEGDQ
jgi:hypothetical protein